MNMLKLEFNKERGVTMVLANNKQKAIVHILKNKYELSDEEYRGLLIDTFDGIDSTTGLDEEECDKFIHILNYKYNQDYKYGYDKGVREYISQLNLETQFKLAIQNKYGREVTELELQMFDKIGYDYQKKDLIESLL